MHERLSRPNIVLPRGFLSEYSFEKAMRRLGRLLLLSYPIFWLGIGKTYPFLLLGPSGPSIGAWFWGVVTFGWLAALLAPRVWEDLVEGPRAEKIFRAWILLGLACTGGFDLLQWFHFERLGYPFPLGLLLADLGLGLLIWFKLSDPDLIRFAWVVAVLHKVGSTITFPLLSERSDMLPTILQSLQRWAHGGEAYAPPTGGIGQMHYLPLTWLSYFPAHVLKIDPRWVGIFYLALIGVLAERWFKEARDSLGAKLIVLWFLNPYLAFRHELYLDFFWLLIAITTASAMRERPGWTAFLSGLALMTLEWAWIIAPFWWLLASRSASWKKLIIVGLVSVSMAATILAPFLLREGDLFINAFSLPLRLIQKGEYTSELCLGLAPLFYRLGWSPILQPIQIIMLLTFGVIGLRLRHQSAVLLGLMALTFLLFVMLNPFLENYFYLAPLLVAAFAQRPLVSAP